MNKEALSRGLREALYGHQPPQDDRTLTISTLGAETVVLPEERTVPVHSGH